MAALAEHVPAIAQADGRVAVPVARRGIPWRAIAAESVFALGLFGLCVALVALRMAVLPQPFMPRGLAFAAFGAATLATIGAFLGAGAIRRR